LKKIRLLCITFDTEIKSYEIPAFRSAIIEKSGRENVLFHNHLGNTNYLYKYPLIQYKQISKKPAIVCIEQGVDEIHKFFENKTWDINISDRWITMKIDQLNMNSFTMQVWDKMFEYSILNWIALNQENYKKYITIEGAVERMQFLENTLKANILSFAKGIEWNIEKQIELKILEIEKINKVKIKEQHIIGFNLKFKTNIFLPNFIGLGKSVSLGYGVIKAIKK